MKLQGQKIVLTKGSQPKLTAFNNEHVLCVWQREKEIHTEYLNYVLQNHVNLIRNCVTFKSIYSVSFVF